MPTRFVPLLRVHIDSSMSTLSPNEYGNGGPPAIADATADLRKSIEGVSRMARFVSVRKTAGGGVWEEGGLAVLAAD